MARTNEVTQQAVPIETGAEITNPPTTEQVTRFPIASRRLIEVRPDMIRVGVQVLACVGLGKETVERAVVWQVPYRRKLQLVQRNVRRIEVNSRNTDGVCGEVAENIAATRRNRDQVLIFLKGQSF